MSEETKNTKVMENRREDRKALKLFFVVLILSGLVGGVLGYTSAGREDFFLGFGEMLGAAVGVVAPYGNWIISTIVLLALSLLMRQCRKRFAAWDGADERVPERIEQKLTYGMSVTFVHMVISFFLFGAGAYAVDIRQAGRDGALWKVVILILGIVYAIGVVVWFQKEIVNLTKEINPEKRGSVYDVRFRKTWMESCDELERLQCYRASYKAYLTVNYTCLALYIFTEIGIVSWDFGLLPMTIVMIIWLAAGLSYGAECIRLAKNPAELMK